MKDHERTLLRLALSDETFIESVLHMPTPGSSTTGLDPKVLALVRLGALLAMEVATPSYEETVSMARQAGASDDEIVGVLLSVASTIGVARVVSAAPKLAQAIGFDIDRALERSES